MPKNESPWTTCNVCNRVLLAEHGPTCEDCLSKPKKKLDEGLVVEPESEPVYVKPVKAGKAKDDKEDDAKGTK